MNEMMIFENTEVEIFEYENKILFNPKHVGKCLEMSEATVRDHLRKMNENQVVKLTNSDVGLTNFRKLNNAGENFLTESGVYKLIMKSRKPSAEKFQDWVTDEVLPSIRKSGSYSIIENNKDKLLLQLFSNDPLEVATAHKQLVEMETAPLIDTIEKQTPKVQVYDDFIDKEHTLGFRELRKELESTLNIVIKENKLKEVMKSLNLIGKTVKATAYAIRNEYAVTKDISHKNGTATQDRFTMKARDLILETIRGDINEIR